MEITAISMVWTTFGAGRAVEAGSETRGALQGSERETSIEVVAKSYRDSLVRRTKELSLAESFEACRISKMRHDMCLISK